MDTPTNVSTVCLLTSLVTSQTHRTTYILSTPLSGNFWGLQIGDMQRRGSKYVLDDDPVHSLELKEDQ